MIRRSFATGHMDAALLKALHRQLTVEKSAAAADGWLKVVGMVRDDLEDETRTVPLPAMHQALKAFVAVASKEAIARATGYLVEADCLATWARVLRGTTGPAEAFGRLDAGESEFGRTTKWETLGASRGHWHGRVTIAHDPALEEDGLLQLARQASLAAVPALFGFRGGAATALLTTRSLAEEETPASRDLARTAMTMTQEFEVRWSAAEGWRWGALGAIAGSLLAGTATLLHPGAPSASVFVLLLSALAGYAAGMAGARESAKRAEGRAQALRVRALERSMLLREVRSSEVGANLEGSVVAGQYRIVSKMGAGATGVIYEALRISDSLPVAIKLLRAAAVHEAVASDRLRREAEALGLAWHPNVVEVIDHGYVADGTAYLVMELLRGVSLATRLKEKGKLSTSEALPIALQICDALAAVHAAGVVHRDVKPSNVYLIRDPDNPAGCERAKLLDFGIARVEWEETRITQTGGPVGTPGYMSPEQEEGASVVDGRADLFGLGAMLFECLTGEPPRPRAGSGALRSTVPETGRYESGTQKAAPYLPPAWRTVIEKAMQINPASRYQDARALAHDLRSIEERIPNAGSPS